VNWQVNGLDGQHGGRATNLQDQATRQRLGLGVTFRSVVPRGPKPSQSPDVIVG
jgi:hypothetical protein